LGREEGVRRRGGMEEETRNGGERRITKEK
jgi:hypothetical protein